MIRKPRVYREDNDPIEGEAAEHEPILFAASPQPESHTVEFDADDWHVRLLPPDGSESRAVELLRALDGAVADFLSEYDPEGPDDPDGASGVYDMALWESHEAVRAFLADSAAPSEGTDD